MQHQNYELATTLFFVNTDNTKLSYAHELKNPKLNPKVYFHPTSYPRIERLDSRLGSCFDDWYVPTEAQIFNVNNRLITDNYDVITDLPLAEYQQIVDQEICNSIIELYNNHNIVNLLYSGSSDSTVVLSYIMKLGLASRTRLVCVNNIATEHPKALRYDQNRINRINKFYQTLGNQFAETIWETSSINNIVNIVNRGYDYYHLQSYSISELFDRYQDQAWANGLHGNRTLLHHWIYLDQHRILFPESIFKLQNEIETRYSQVYSPSIRRMKFDSPPIPLKYVTHSNKLVKKLSGYRGNTIHMPLGTDRIFQALRRLNVAEITFDIVADAQFAKDLIAKNQPELLAWMDQQQTSHEFMNMENVTIPTHNLDYNQLEIPLDLNHDPDGLHWLQQQIAQSKQQGTIEINTLMSIKNLQLIYHELNNNSNATIPVTSDQFDA